MTYFERLVRRARMQPARRPGDPFPDPFEQTDTWPLDVPQSTESPKPAAALPAAAIQPQTSPADRTVVAEAAAMSPPIAAPAPHAVPADVTSREVLSSEISRERTEVEVMSVETVREAVASEIAAPLAHADAFLRSLGVRIPALEPLPEIASAPPTAPQPASLPADRPARPSRPQVLAPLALPQPAPARQATSPAAPDVDARVAAPPREEAARTASRPIVTTREVHVIDRRATARDSGSRPSSGVGAPHVGLGQL